MLYNIANSQTVDPVVNNKVATTPSEVATQKVSNNKTEKQKGNSGKKEGKSVKEKKDKSVPKECQVAFKEGDYLKVIIPFVENKISFQKGEIYKCASKNEFYFGENKVLFTNENVDTIKVLPSLTNTNDSTLIRKKNNGFYYITLSSISKVGDTVLLVKGNNDILHFITKEERDSIFINECGSSFRFIIPAHPTIVYDTSMILPIKNHDTTRITEGFFSRKSHLQYCIGLISLILGFCLGFYFRKIYGKLKCKKDEIEERY